MYGWTSTKSVRRLIIYTIVRNLGGYMEIGILYMVQEVRFRSYLRKYMRATNGKFQKGRKIERLQSHWSHSYVCARIASALHDGH